MGKAVSKIGSKRRVFSGTKEKTAGGLTKADLVKAKSGKIVSKKRLAAAKKAYAHIKGWTIAVQKARKHWVSRASSQSRRARPSTKRQRSSTSEHARTGFSSG